MSDTSQGRPRDPLADARMEEMKALTAAGGGPASTIHIEVGWCLWLNKRDALLVLKALGGRLASKAEENEAEALGDRLTLMRERDAQDQLRHLQYAAEGVRKKQATA